MDGMGEVVVVESGDGNDAVENFGEIDCYCGVDYAKHCSCPGM